MKIYLIGYMASGKTNLGKEMAAVSGMPMVDMDDLFEEKYRLSISEFFEKYGESVFRRLEHGILEDTFRMDDVIISTGGGTPCFFDNMNLILQNGVSVYLKTPVEVVARRLRGIRKKRPLLKEVPEEELETFITAQIREREAYYRRADYVVEGPDIDAGEILKKIQTV